MEMQTATSSGSWLQVQLLKIRVVTGFLPMGNGNAYDQLSCILVPAAGAAPGIYTMPLSLASAMENGDPSATCILSWDAARAAGNYCGWSCELGNGEWRMMRCTCCQGCGSCTIFICQLGEGQWAMEPMDGATIPGKIYSKL